MAVTSGRPARRWRTQRPSPRPCTGVDAKAEGKLRSRAAPCRRSRSTVDRRIWRYSGWWFVTTPGGGPLLLGVTPGPDEAAIPPRPAGLGAGPSDPEQRGGRCGRDDPVGGSVGERAGRSERQGGEALPEDFELSFELGDPGVLVRPDGGEEFLELGDAPVLLLAERPLQQLRLDISQVLPGRGGRALPSRGSARSGRARRAEAGLSPAGWPRRRRRRRASRRPGCARSEGRGPVPTGRRRHSGPAWPRG